MILKAPGMTPEEVETRVITPIEMELLGIPHQTILRSAAKYAIADITLDFEDGTDIYWARQQVAERLAGVRDQLPANVTGGLAPVSTPLSDVFMFTIDGGELVARGAPQPARLDHPAGSANDSGRRRCQRPRRHGPHIRSRSRQRGAWQLRVSASTIS